jgi:hypothetical protein
MVLARKKKMVLDAIEVSALYRAEEELKGDNVEILSNPTDSI